MNDDTLNAIATARSICERKILAVHDAHLALISRALATYTAEVELAIRQRDLAIENAKFQGLRRTPW